jgi:putative DNA primase/helicase
LAAVHVTYLSRGRKLEGHEPRKILAPLVGREGCAVQLSPVAGDVLGIAEGIETALSAQREFSVTTWAALNAALLAKFDPPETVKRLVICADRDVAGLEAAGRLMERLQSRCSLELRPPRAPAKDWNDELLCRTGVPQL